MKIIQLELNEVSRNIIDKLISQGKLNNFHVINQKYSYFTTDVNDKYENIEPWIQWISAHTGKSFDEHQVFHLGDVSQLRSSQVWEILSDNGLESAIIGSMNAKQGRMSGGIFFPDPWSKNGKSYPSDLQPLWNLVASKVQDHAASKLTFLDILSGLRCCWKYQIPINLYFRIGKQIILQKLNPKRKWRMAALFDELLSCIFIAILKKTDFSFYTLFLNSCAHYQHHYWREFEKDMFASGISSPDICPNDDPVSYGYEIYNRILGKVLKYVESKDDVALIIATAFTQEPYTQMEYQGGMNYYRLINHQELLCMLNLGHYTAFPMMSRDWQVDVNTTSHLDLVADALNGLTLAGENLFSVKKNTNSSLFVYTLVTRKVNQDEIIYYKDKFFASFYDLFVNIAIKSGHHISTGSLWVSNLIDDSCLNKKESVPVSRLFDISLATLGVSLEQ